MKDVFKRMNPKAAVIALVHFLTGFFTDRWIFSYTVLDFSDLRLTLKSIETIGVKLCYLLLLLFLWQGIFWFIKKADVAFKRRALAYFLLNMILLLFIWPGIWRMDEFGILSGALSLIPKFWQNYLTSVFYIFSLMLVPTPAGVIIVQAAIVSLLFAHVLSLFTEQWKHKKGIVDNFSEMTGETGENSAENPSGQVESVMVKNAGISSKWTLLLMIPFVMFPVLDSNLYPMRMSLWAFLELTLLSQCFFLSGLGEAVRRPEKGENSASRLSKSLTGMKTELSDNFSTTAVLNGGKLRLNLVVTCVLAAVVTVWRTEAVYYLILFPALLLLIDCRWKKEKVEITNTNVILFGRGNKKEKSSDKRTAGFKMWKYILLYWLCFVILFLPQKVGEKLESGSQYELTGMVLPLVPLIKEASQNGSDRDGKLLRDIDRVVNVEVTLQGEAEGKNGINLFWGEPRFQRSYGPEEFAAFRKAYYTLVLRYPAVFLKERWQTFTQSHDLLMDTTLLHTDMENPNHRQFATYPLSTPISEEVRNGVICLLELRRRGNYSEKLWAADPVYSSNLPIVILALCLVVCLVRRRWMESALLLCSLVKVPLVFLTAPSRLFMYYYPVYLVGYCVLFYILYQWLKKRKSR